MRCSRRFPAHLLCFLRSDLRMSSKFMRASPAHTCELGFFLAGAVLPLGVAGSRLWLRWPRQLVWWMLVGPAVDCACWCGGGAGDVGDGRWVGVDGVVDVSRACLLCDVFPLTCLMKLNVYFHWAYPYHTLFKQVLVMVYYNITESLNFLCGSPFDLLSWNLFIKDRIAIGCNRGFLKVMLICWYSFSFIKM